MTKQKGRTPPTRHGGPFDSEKQGQVFITSGYGGNTRVPFVEIEMPGQKPLQFESDEARRIAHMILEAAETADQDAFLVELVMEFLTDEAEPEVKRLGIAAGMLNEFREWREMRRNKRRTPSA
jgi:hypothetical protein